MDGNRKRRKQAAVFMRQEICEIQDAKESALTTDARQVPCYFDRKTHIVGLPDHVQMNVLKKENQRLKALVEDLIHDKACQANRIKELHEEKSRLKKAIAELIAGK